MRISIAMCTYNGARYLQRQLESFACQTHLPCELVVCDDGSTDSTLVLIERFAGQVGFPVRIFKNEHSLGSTKNFDKAIGLCGGDLIALSDQDDEWYPDKLAKMQQLFEEFPKALAAFSDADLIGDESSLVGRKLWRSLHFSPETNSPRVDAGAVSSLLKLNYIATGATMVFRSEFRSHFIPIPDAWVHDAWISRMAALRDGLAFIPAATIRYRVHSQQQIGVAPPSIRDQIALARKNGAPFRLIAMRLKALRLYLEERKKDDQLAKFIPDLDAKIRHIECRASLRGSALRRLPWILHSWRDYQRFARGAISMISDAVLLSGEEIPAESSKDT